MNKFAIFQQNLYSFIQKLQNFQNSLVKNPCKSAPVHVNMATNEIKFLSTTSMFRVNPPPQTTKILHNTLQHDNFSDPTRRDEKSINSIRSRSTNVQLNIFNILLISAWQWNHFAVFIYDLSAKNEVRIAGISQLTVYCDSVIYPAPVNLPEPPKNVLKKVKTFSKLTPTLGKSNTLFWAFLP